MFPQRIFLQGGVDFWEEKLFLWKDGSKASVSSAVFESSRVFLHFNSV